MSTSTPVKIALHSRNFKELPPTHGSITKIEYDKKERTENGIKAFGLFFALMIASIFVPIVHFFAVPGFFLAAFWFGKEKLEEKYHNGGGEGECPKCHQSVSIGPTKFTARLTDTCGHCFEDLEIFVEN